VLFPIGVPFMPYAIWCCEPGLGGGGVGAGVEAIDRLASKEFVGNCEKEPFMEFE